MTVVRNASSADSAVWRASTAPQSGAVLRLSVGGPAAPALAVSACIAAGRRHRRPPPIIPAARGAGPEARRAPPAVAEQRDRGGERDAAHQRRVEQDRDAEADAELLHRQQAQ